MPLRRLLIANRGEIAIRVSRAAAELGLETVAVFSRDDRNALHVRKADQAVELNGAGPGAYLDIEGIVAAAVQSGCDALHPGYGFLSENATLARRCADAGVRFVGPHPEALELFGDKVRSRVLADRCGVPVPGGTTGATDVDGARALLADGAIMIKAVSGGGGRGMRVVTDASELDEAFERSSSEARAAFGDGSLYVERLIADARHVEVQVLGDGVEVVHLHERDCTIQRRHQKLVEVAPSPSLHPGLKARLTGAALAMARSAGYDSLGTFEFLVEAPTMGQPDGPFVFIEANPRLQVEHTVTEEVTGVDLVKAQLRIAGGETLEGLGLTQDRVPEPRGFAIQLRVNMETMDRAGHVTPAGGTLEVFEPPSGPGIRVDSFAYAGYRTSAAFDSLLAKLIVSSPSPSYEDVLVRARRALAEFRIEGVETNLPFLAAVLRDPDFGADRIHTRFVEERLPALVSSAASNGRHLYFSGEEAGRAARTEGPATVKGPPGTEPVVALVRGTVVSISVSEGDPVIPGQPVAVVEAMKMEHVVTALTGGIVRLIAAKPGETVEATDALVHLEPAGDLVALSEQEAEEVDLDEIRPDLAELLERKHEVSDAGRPDKVARRHGLGQRTARENIEDLVDPGSFAEYGAHALAAQRGRRTYEQLRELSPADGLIAGLASINGDRFADDRSRAMVISYDWTVFAGTQGIMGHKKTDRALLQAQRLGLPVVLFAEGGGGRPGDTEMGPAGLDVLTFWHFARLSGSAPLIGVTSRFCFAGNAALLGICDVIIATEGSNIGMGGPAMIEGGGLGVVGPTEIGPSDVQSANGVIDVLVRDEAAAVAAARQYLSYFQGAVDEWEEADQRLLRRAIPENRLRAYDVREVIHTLADKGSVLELRRNFGVGMITAFIRVEGRPMGLIANNPRHLGGAVDADAADKGARFMQLCDAYGLPILSLCDTPGFMVGPDAEAEAQVRHVSRLFVTAANVSVPMFTVVLRKGYGLGAQGSTGGSFHAPVFLVAWPTGEFGGMGLEGHVRLAFRKELEAIEDPGARQAEYERLVAQMYAQGRALSMAEHFEIDDVIDPADTRRWIVRGLKSSPSTLRQGGVKTRPNIDTW